MRIAHFTNTYHPNINGVARSVSTFREGLTRLGHQVFVFAQQAPARYKETEPFVFRYRGVNIPQFNYSLTVPHSRFVNWLLPSLQLHVIHSNHPILLGEEAANKAEALGLPLVFTFHTHYVQYAEEYTAYVPISKAFVENRVVEGLARYLNRCHHIITPSDSIKQNLADYAGLTERVTTVPTGIDLAPYQQADGQVVRRQSGWEGKKVLVSIGRLATEKNFETLLAAAARVMARRDDVQLVLIGDGPQRKELERTVRSLGIQARVTFTGRLPFEQVPGTLKAADLFCFASVTETQGLVTMEAMAAGLPVVAVNATGTRDSVVHRQEGLLTENDAGALAQAIQQALDDEALYVRLKTGAQEKAKLFDMMVQTEKMVAVYEQAIEDNKAGRKINIALDLVRTRIKAGQSD